MDTENGFAGWVWAAVCTIVSTLSGLVAFFYRQQIIDYKANAATLTLRVENLEKRADACEDDRESLRIECAVMKSHISDLEANKKNRDSIG